MLARPGPQPGVLDDRGAVHGEEVAEGDDDVDAGVGAGPVGHHLGADQQLAALLEGVVVALADGAEVVGAASFAEGFQDGGDGGGALGGQVAADPAGAVHGGVQEEVPVAEPAAVGVFVGVGLLGAPGLVGGLGDELQVVEAGAGGGGLDEDLVGLGLEVVVVDPAGPPGDLPRPRDRERPGGGGGVQVGVAGEQPHLPDGGPGVLGPEAVPGREPGGAGGVPVGVVIVVGVEPPQDPVGRRPEQGGDRPELLQGLAPGRASRPSAAGEFR